MTKSTLLKQFENTSKVEANLVGSTVLGLHNSLALDGFNYVLYHDTYKLLVVLFEVVDNSSWLLVFDLLGQQHLLTETAVSHKSPSQNGWRSFLNLTDEQGLQYVPGFKIIDLALT